MPGASGKYLWSCYRQPGPLGCEFCPERPVGGRQGVAGEVSEGVRQAGCVDLVTAERQRRSKSCQCIADRYRAVDQSATAVFQREGSCGCENRFVKASADDAIADCADTVGLRRFDCQLRCRFVGRWHGDVLRRERPDVFLRQWVADLVGNVRCQPCGVGRDVFESCVTAKDGDSLVIAVNNRACHERARGVGKCERRRRDGRAVHVVGKINA